MTREITALRTQKRNKDRVSVYLDGEFGFGLPAIEAMPLKVGQQLTDEEIIQLQMKDEIERAYDRALNFLSYRPRSEAEVRRNLRQKDIESTVIEAVVARLTRAGLLDDQEFARYWVDNRTRFNPRGLRGLRYELRQKGISSAIIDEALATVDVESAVRQAAEKGARRLSNLSPRDFRRKLQAYLKRRGFSYSVIKPVVEEKLEEARCQSDIKSEGNQ
jgi:regulatory protein